MWIEAWSDYQQDEYGMWDMVAMQASARVLINSAFVVKFEPVWGVCIQATMQSGAIYYFREPTEDQLQWLFTRLREAEMRSA